MLYFKGMVTSVICSTQFVIAGIFSLQKGQNVHENWHLEIFRENLEILGKSFHFLHFQVYYLV